MKFLLIVAVMSFGLTSFADEAAPPAGGKPAMREKMKEMRAKMREENKEMHEKVVQACSADVATTGCKEEPGKGLGKCIHQYKKEHNDFKVSETCKAALQDRREMHKEHKSERAEMHKEHMGDKGQAPAPAPAEKK